MDEVVVDVSCRGRESSLFDEVMIKIVLHQRHGTRRHARPIARDNATFNQQTTQPPQRRKIALASPSATSVIGGKKPANGRAVDVFGTQFPAFEPTTKLRHTSELRACCLPTIALCQQ